MKDFIYKIGRDAYIDWGLTLAISGLILVALLANGLLTYFNLDATLEAPSTAQPSTLANIDIKKLDDVITTFDARSTERAALIKSYTGPADPSL